MKTTIQKAAMTRAKKFMDEWRGWIMVGDVQLWPSAQGGKIMRLGFNGPVKVCDVAQSTIDAAIALGFLTDQLIPVSDI